ncbi:MAG: peptidylprolyl isomerase [Myxococcales bacterium FL481]|nr:MAG: peptidylprolyl isomerase [Myxococcales bacterium FL481]
MSTQSVSDSKVVSISYTLRNGAGEVLDTSTADDPLLYLHGAENIVPGLEHALAGREVGSTLSVTVVPDDGYGERSDDPPQKIPREVFEEADVEVGASILAEDDEGNQTVLWVVEIQDEAVLVDENHPLAGETLHFDVEVLAVRDATEDELEQGHPHGGDEERH